VYGRYAVTFFVIANGKLHFPQYAENDSPAPVLRQQRQDNYLPVVITTYQPPLGITVEQRTLSTVVGAQHHAAVLNRLVVRASGAGSKSGQLGVAVVPVKPSGFVRYGKMGEALQASQLSYLRYLPAERRLETNTGARAGLCVRTRVVRAVRERERRQARMTTGSSTSRPACCHGG
jgi:hypothetical protein